jgi:NADH-quinone oxidoreductase subunit M
MVGFLYERTHSLDISAYGGVATPAPWLSTAFMITMLASMGLPTLSNFIGEYLVLQGSSLVNMRWTVFAAIGVILSACYVLWLYQRVFYGKASEDLTHHMPDLNAREYAIMVPLIVLMVWMGTYTQSFIPPISASNAVLLGPIDARREIHVQARPPKAPITVAGELAGELGTQELNHAR